MSTVDLGYLNPFSVWEQFFALPSVRSRKEVSPMRVHGLIEEDALIERIHATEKVQSYQRQVHAHDIESFAGLSGDRNPIHLDEDYAKSSRFKGVIAHGMLTAAFISARIGEQYPGCAYISQSLFFTAPVRPWDTVFTAIAPIRAIKRRLTLACVCRIGSPAGSIVLHGDAEILLPK